MADSLCLSCFLFTPPERMPDYSKEAAQKLKLKFEGHCEIRNQIVNKVSTCPQYRRRYYLTRYQRVLCRIL